MKGTCQGMCSAREAQERDAQGDTSLFEATAETRMLRRSMRRMDKARAVKRFRRAADGRPEGPEEVRPLGWLDRTVTHLWAVVGEELAVAAAKEEDEDGAWIVELFDFVADRLQAVRKDVVIQGLTGPRVIAIFERVVRFHVLFGYLLSQQAAPAYDEHLGLTALRSGLGTLIDLYKEAALSSSTSAAAPSSQGDGLAHVDEFLAYNVLVQAYDTVRASGGGVMEAAGWGKLLLLLRRALTALYGRASGGGCQLPPQTRLALRALVALATEDYMAFLRLHRSGAPAPSARAAAAGALAAAATTPTSGEASSTVLVRCLLHRLLPVVRRRILDVWSKTLFKKERMPLVELARLLAFDTPAQAKAFSAVHGVAIVETAVASLDAWGDEPQPCRHSSAYIEPRLATVSQPAVGQTYEARRKQQRALAPRQDRVVLELEKQGGLAALWDAVGGPTP